ncbi:hypothetical protein [Afifella pfennigii]|uniref:hypothetical protein n=1 Tax=Afifella pfennigii TaxID=209897 RepID=UPI0005532806|nr:hypothetical protein [Afifella pfennigii]
MTLSPQQMERLEAEYCHPETGSIRRRWIGRKLAGVVAVGPSEGMRLPTREPTKAELAAKAKEADEDARRHRKTVQAEIAALDHHAEDVARKFKAAGNASYQAQELRAEKRQLAELRLMLQEDLAVGPIMTDGGGGEISRGDRAYIRQRALEIADSFWQQSIKLDATGDRREARRKRVDSLRARQIAEYEAGWRASLLGYGLSVWS